MVKGNSLKRLYELFNTDDAIEDYIFYICSDRSSDGFKFKFLKVKVEGDN